MSLRHLSREIALQFLYHHEQSTSVATLSGKQAETLKEYTPQSISKLLVSHFEHFKVEPQVREFAAELSSGVLLHMSELDQKIEQLAKNWKMGRMPIIDRNLLRLSLFEILYQKNTPHSVVINEAVELAKRFGTADSSSFINALLDHAAKEQQQQGFTLIETLIALSILAVIGVAFLQMTDNQRKQFQYFQNKSDLIETKNFLVETFSRPDTCSWQLSSSKTKQFLDIESKQSDGTTLNSEIQLTELRSGISPSSSLLAQVNAPISTRNSPVVDQIKLSKIQQIANNSFEGWLSISFKKSNNGFAYNPISFRKLFSVDVSKPHAAAVLNCN